MKGFPDSFAAPRTCEHNWQPVSMVFETQVLDEHGRVVIRQPDIQEGRVYFVCTGCASHVYMTTQWLGVRMYGSEDAIPLAHRGVMGLPGIERPAWSLAEEEDCP